MLSTQPCTQDWCLDPFWFPMWAQIIVPSLVGLATLSVAFAAFRASKNATTIAAESQRKLEQRENRRARAAFVDAIIESRLTLLVTDQPVLERKAIVVGHDAVKLLPWFRRQHSRADVGNADTSQDYPRLKGSLVNEFDSRLMEWVSSGAWNDADY